MKKIAMFDEEKKPEMSAFLSFFRLDNNSSFYLRKEIVNRASCVVQGWWNLSVSLCYWFLMHIFVGFSWGFHFFTYHTYKIARATQSLKRSVNHGVNLAWTIKKLHIFAQYSLLSTNLRISIVNRDWCGLLSVNETWSYFHSLFHTNYISL